MSSNTAPEFLIQIDEALANNSPTLDAAIDTVLDQQVSNYPILVWHRDGEAPEIGVALLNDARPGPWNIRITTLEELVTKKVVDQQRISSFRERFSNARQEYCLFVVVSGGAQFAFRPRS